MVNQLHFQIAKCAGKIQETQYNRGENYVTTSTKNTCDI